MDTGIWRLFDTQGFVPRWDCGNWTNAHAYLHIFSDLGVWSAYLAIPMVLGYFILRKRNMPFRFVFVLFGAFIFACGTTHLMEAIIFWWPGYRLAGVIKLLTAVVSWGTVAALIPITPLALAMRAPQELEQEIAERERAEAALKRLHAELEDRVRQRTAELAQANAALEAEIAERRRTEEALRQQREWFQGTLSSIGDAVIATDPLGCVTFVNPSAERLTGWTQLEAVGQPLNALVRIVTAEQGEPVELPPVGGLVREDSADIAQRHLLIGRDGLAVPVDESAAPIQIEGGESLGSVIVLRDMSELRQSEQAFRFLAEASASLAALVDYESTLKKVARLAVPYFADWCLVDVVGEDNHIERVAAAHADPAKQPLLERFGVEFPSDWDKSTVVTRVLKSGQSELHPEVSEEVVRSGAINDEHLELIHVLGPRSAIWAPLSVHGQILGAIGFVISESGRRYGPSDLALAEDLAGRAAIALENARLYREVRDADRRKDEFLAMLAHELRNPLAPIRNATYILGAPDIDPAAAGEARGIIERQVQHLIRLVDDLLDVSRIMRGKIELRRESFDVATAVHRAVEAAKPLIDAQRHRFDLVLPSEPVWIHADLIRIAQVIGNLLNNAAKYTEPGGRIELSAAAIDGEVEIRVRDSGVGISREMLPRVFRLFTQADYSLERSQGGLGIGLTVVQTLVTMHGGSVSAESAGKGQGSEFVVRLPRIVPVDTAAMSPESAPLDAPAPVSRRVLVVDDNIDAAQTLAAMLRMHRHHVDVAHDGPTALDLAMRDRPEVILLDIGLPGMSGYEVARRIRQQVSSQPMLIAAVTGYGQSEDRRRSAEAGIDIHLVKPIDPHLLRQMMIDPGGLQESEPAGA